MALTKPLSTQRGRAFFEVASSGESVPVRTDAAKKVTPDDAAAWFALGSGNTYESRQWAAALRRPIEYTMEELRRRPARAAVLLAPVMDAALAQARRDRLQRLQEVGWQWMAIAVNPQLWPNVVKALWEGEPVWDFLEKRAQWYQVVEAMLIDSNSNTLLGYVESPHRRLTDGEVSLEKLMRMPAAECGKDDEIGSPAADDSESRVLVLVGEQCKLAVRVYGHPADTLRPALQQLCEEGDRMLDRANVEPRGRTSMIERLLQRALLKTSPASSPWTWPTAMLAGGLAAVLIFGLVLQYGMQEWRWQKALRALAQEPGIEVVQDHTAWGRREVIGFTDPHARSPHAVLLGAGVNPEGITFNFKEYLSGEPAFVLTRPNMGPRLVVAYDPVVERYHTRKVPEKAPELQKAAARIPTLAESMELRTSSIEAMVLDFPSGTEALSDVAKSTLADMCRQVVELQDMATKAGLRLSIAFHITHTSAAVQGALWQLRDSAVRDALIASGVRSVYIEPALVAPPGGESHSDGIAPDTLSLRITVKSSNDTPQ